MQLSLLVVYVEPTVAARAVDQIWSTEVAFVEQNFTLDLHSVIAICKFVSTARKCMDKLSTMLLSNINLSRFVMNSMMTEI